MQVWGRITCGGYNGTNTAAGGRRRECSGRGRAGLPEVAGTTDEQRQLMRQHVRRGVMKPAGRTDRVADRTLRPHPPRTPGAPAWLATPGAPMTGTPAWLAVPGTPAMETPAWLAVPAAARRQGENRLPGSWGWRPQTSRPCRRHVPRTVMRWAWEPRYCRDVGGHRGDAENWG